jgi:hypothetical protein
LCGAALVGRVLHLRKFVCKRINPSIWLSLSFAVLLHLDLTALISSPPRERLEAFFSFGTALFSKVQSSNKNNFASPPPSFLLIMANP